MKEIWKDIPWYECLYQASTDWNIKSLKFWKEKILKPWNNWSWYLKVNLSKNKKVKIYSVHRLILLTFKWPSKLDVNHINWDKSDNRLENLEYCTKSENMKHTFIYLWNVPHNKWKFWKNNHSSKKVNQYTKNWKFIKTWYSLSDISRELWINIWSITNCCKWHKNYSHAWWFIFKYHIT